MATSPKRSTSSAYPIGYFHVDIAERRTAEGKLYLFIAIDRTSKFAFASVVERANTKTAAAFLDSLVATVPYEVHTVLTDNGIQFADLARNRNGPTARFRGHPFDRACWRHSIEHRLTKPNHPWTNGQAERMNRTIKEATVKRFHYDSHERLRNHLDAFVSAYNFARRLKTLQGLTPYEYICKVWTLEPQRFNIDPTHQIPGSNTTCCASLSGWAPSVNHNLLKSLNLFGPDPKTRSDMRRGTSLLQPTDTFSFGYWTGCKALATSLAVCTGFGMGSPICVYTAG